MGLCNQQIMSRTYVVKMVVLATLTLSACTGGLTPDSVISKNKILSVDFLSMTPDSPSRSSDPPELRVMMSADVEIVTFFKDEKCELPIGSGAAEDLKKLSAASVGINLNATTRIFAQGKGKSGELGDCKFLKEYVHKNTPPTDPAFVSVSPAIVSSVSAPSVIGTASSDTTHVLMYADNACATPIGQATKEAFESTGAAIATIPNMTMQVYAQALDFVGNKSSCVLMTPYTHDNVAPTVAGVSFDPASPSKLSLSPKVIGTTSADTAAVTLYTDSLCANQLASPGTKSAFEGVGLSLTATANSSTSVYGRATDAAGNVGSCTLLSSYVHDSVAPANPSFVSTDPASPSNSSSTPLVKGVAPADAVTVTLYSNAACTAQVGTGTKDAFNGSGITATAAENASTAIYSTVADAAGNVSACTLLTTFVHNNNLPNGPVLAQISPNSPSKDSITPSLRGSVQAQVVTVKLFSDSLCQNLLATGSDDDWVAGMAVTVTANASTSIYGLSIDNASNQSACTSLTTYVHDSVAPSAPTFSTINPIGPSTTLKPTLSGGSPADAVSVAIFSDVACSSQLGTGTKAAWDGVGVALSSNVPSDASTTLYAQASDLAGNKSTCASMVSYTHDATPPASPVVSSSNPVSPSNSDTTPELKGTASSDTAKVFLFSDSGCSSSPIGDGTKSVFEGAGITTSMSANSTTTVYGYAQDAALNNSSCTSLFSYTHDSVGPAAPSGFSFVSANPSIANTNTITGAASSDTATVEFFTNAACTVASPGSTGSKNKFETAGVDVTGSNNAVTSFYARALDAAGNASSCAAAGNMTADSQAPNLITSIAHGAAVASLTTSPAFTITGGGTDNGPAGFSAFEYSFGSSAGATDRKAWTDVGVSTSIAAQSGLTLTSGSTYYVNVRTKDAAGNVSAAISSSGWYASGAPAALAWDTQPAGTNVVAGSPFTTQPKVKIVDSAGNTVKAAANTAITITTFANSTCSLDPVVSVQVATVNPVTTTEGLASYAGVGNQWAMSGIYLRASAAGYTSICSANSMSTIAGPAAKILASTKQTVLTAGEPGGQSVTVEITDIYGNIQSTGSDTITLSFATDSACTNAAPNSAPFVWSFDSNPMATTAASVSFTSPTYTKAGTFYVKAQSTKFGSACTTAIVVSGAAATQLGFVGPKAAPEGMCSNSVDLQALDTYGNRADLGSARSIDLTQTGGMEFYTSSDCTGKNFSSVDLEGAQAQQSLFIKTTAAESVTLTATDTTGSPLTVATHPFTAGTISGLELGNGIGCAIVAGYAFCWGEDPNAYGMKGSTFSSSDDARPVMVEGLSNVTQVSVGETSACAIAGGNVYCWGKNDYYQVRGDAGVESAIPVAVQGLSGTFEHVTVGDSFACASKSNQTVFCWGKNDSGQIGSGVMSSMSQTSQVTSLNGYTVTQFNAGDKHVCAITEDSIHCWGSDAYGQMLGQGDQAERLWLMDTGIQIVNGNGTCWQMGAGTFSCLGKGPLGDGTTNDASSPVDVTNGDWPKTPALSSFTGAASQFCLLVDGMPYCWGGNTFSQIGDQTTDQALAPVAVTADGEQAVDAIAMGKDFACVLRSNRINCWGRGGPQLGNVGQQTSGLNKPTGTAVPIDLW
jgi:hypothetical protein